MGSINGFHWRHPMHLRVINPNTTAAMTETIGQAARRAAAAGTRIVATHPRGGPESIESHVDEAVAAVGVLEEVRAGELDGADGYVIACFGDPGLSAARELTRAPVVGIAEAAFHLATLVATRFSVVTTLGRTIGIAEHLLQRYGFAHHCRRVRAAEIPVLDLEHDPEAALRRIVEEARRAKAEDGIGAIVLGCGGMASLTTEISREVGLPVVEGVTAAVKLVEALVGLGLQTSKFGELDFPRPKTYTGPFSHFGA
jgi:allantoin racemase